MVSLLCHHHQESISCHHHQECHSYVIELANLIETMGSKDGLCIILRGMVGLITEQSIDHQTMQEHGENNSSNASTSRRVNLHGLLGGTHRPQHPRAALAADVHGLGAPGGRARDVEGSPRPADSQIRSSLKDCWVSRLPSRWYLRLT